ncbi:MAG: biopolymer transporter ExbD [Pseudomonadota bacterium]
MARRAPLPERPRRYRFALTPLADAMFQLLIFFMLSTSLTPYSLLTLKSAEAGVEESAPETPGAGAGEDQAGPDLGRISFWTVQAGLVRVDEVAYDMDQLGPLAEALGEQDDPGEIVILVSPDARVQDVATALEALAGANIDAVQITQEGI